MTVRAKALARFGENNIRTGTPMAMLEDVLVPVYFFHRYQVEAATKVVGGQFYTYALKGDGQVITRMLTREEQWKALVAVAECMDPSVLLISPRIVSLIPPRPAGYDYTRELFNRRTGLAFDPLAAAESAADLPLSFLFNTDRLDRMVEYQAQYNGLGVGEMIDLLLLRTWKATPRTGLEELILRQNQQLLLTYLLSVSINTDASFAVRAAALNGIETIRTWVVSQQKSTPSPDAATKGYLLLTLERIKAPEKAFATLHMAAPPGSPIGSDTDDE
jgi:hypothetical protein